MSHLLIVNRRPCHKCEGTGQQYNHHWTMFLQAWKGMPVGSPAERLKQQEAFFNEHGYTTIPDIIEPCIECAGTGEIKKIMPAGTISQLTLQVEPVSELGHSVCDSPLNKLGTAASYPQIAGGSGEPERKTPAF